MGELTDMTEERDRDNIRLDGVGWSTTESIAFQRPSFCAATSASKRLDVRIEWEVRLMERGATLSVRTLLVPHGVLRFGQPILRRFMWHQWEHHLLPSVGYRRA